MASLSASAWAHRQIGGSCVAFASATGDWPRYHSRVVVVEVIPRMVCYNLPERPRARLAAMLRWTWHCMLLSSVVVFLGCILRNGECGEEWYNRG